MSKITIKEKVLKVMEWDIPFHLTELAEKVGAEYGTISKIMDDYLKEGLVERVQGESGTYVKYSKRGKIKSELDNTLKQLKFKEKNILQLREEYKGLAEKYKDLKEQLELLDQDSNI